MTQSAHSRKTFTRWLLAIAALLAGGLVAYRGVVKWQRQSGLRAESQKEEKLRLPLEKMVSMSFGKEVPLRTWLDEFTRQTGMVVEVAQGEVAIHDSPQQPAVLAYDFGSQSPIWLDLPAMPAGELLQAVGELHEVRWLVRSDGTVVLNCAPDELQRSLRVYPLPAALGLEMDEQELEDLLTTYVDPDTWEDAGERGAVEHSPGVFTVLQTDLTHCRIGQFFLALAAARLRVQNIPAMGLAHDDAAWQPVWLAGDPRRSEAWQRALDRPITLRCVDLPWSDFVASLAEQAQFPIVVHPCEQRQGQVFSGTVTCRLDKVPLRQVLQQVFGEESNGEPAFGFGPAAGGRLLVITHKFGAQTPLAYPVSDLIRAGHDDDREALQEVIYSAIQPDSWADYGGPASLEWADDGRLLLISQRLDLHQQVRELLSALRQVRSGQRRSVAFRYGAESADAALEAKMEQPVSLHYSGQALPDVLDDLQQRWDITLSTDAFAREIMAHTDKPVWCHLPARPLKENLEILCDQCGLKLIVQEGRYQLTMHDDQRPDKLGCEVFDLRPWLAKEAQSDDLAELIGMLVDPDSWQDVGGEGSVRVFCDMLVVNCYPHLMPRVKDLLAVLHEHLTPGKPRRWRGEVLTADALSRPLALWPESEATTARIKVIEQKLQQPESIDFKKVKMGDAILTLASRYELPLVLHKLPAGCTSSQSLLSIQATNEPLGDVLNQMIDGTAIWRLQRECLVVIAAGADLPEPTGGLLYSIHDLVRPQGKLLSGQVERTLDKHFGVDQAPSDTFYAQYLFGDLILLTVNPEQPSRQKFEQALRDLRSGKLKPLPVEAGDASGPTPNGFRPFLVNPIVPEVGSRQIRNLK